MRRTCLACLLLSPLAVLADTPAAPAPAAAAPVPFEHFARFPQFGNVTISPGGEYLGAIVPADGRDALAFLRVSDLKPVGAYKLPGKEQVASYWWVSDNRVVMTPAIAEGPLDQPVLTGELAAVDVDGKRSAYLYGYRGAASTGTLARNNAAEYGYATVLDTLPEDPDHILIQTQSFLAGGNDYTRAFKLNVYSGERQRIGVAPLGGFGYLVADPALEVRYAVVTDHRNILRTWWRPSEKADWIQEDVGELASAYILPLGFSRDGQRVFLRSTETGSVYCLVERSLGETPSRRTLACDQHGDLGRVVMDPQTREPIAATFAPGRPRAVVLDNESLLGKRYAQLLESFEARGEFVEPVSSTQDGSKVILYAYSDRNPGDYYLFETATGKARYLLSEREWIDPERMGPRRAITYKARDGQLIHAYLTLPPGRPAKNLPLVVMPHGGPKGPRDHWAWEADSQAMASRGYAVLQPNFRGSGGYGVKFEEDSKYAWGTTLIDDITDGTRWAVEQGIADPSRLCIIGGSYGGYAALMSAVREPDLYRCAVSFVGVTDIEALLRDSDTADSERGRIEGRRWVAPNDQVAREQSPIHYVDKLKAALFLVHGDNDQRVPYSQMKALRSKLDERKYPYEQLVKAGEGHGFYKEENRVEYLQRLIAFLDRHIGRPPVAAPAP
ncbi:MAG TPA: S9 family peptidase [Nevskiaceae bacterium]|nr:S9 family peptidase [Nevskiaceae bacterium]